MTSISKDLSVALPPALDLTQQREMGKAVPDKIVVEKPEAPGPIYRGSRSERESPGAHCKSHSPYHHKRFAIRASCHALLVVDGGADMNHAVNLTGLQSHSCYP